MVNIKMNINDGWFYGGLNCEFVSSFSVIFKLSCNFCNLQNYPVLFGPRFCVILLYHMSCDVRKPVFSVSVQVRNKPVCTVTEEGLTPIILDFRRKGIVLCSKNEGRCAESATAL